MTFHQVVTVSQTKVDGTSAAAPIKAGNKVVSLPTNVLRISACQTGQTTGGPRFSVSAVAVARVASSPATYRGDRVTHVGLPFYGRASRP